jgi:hypothetical protein
VEREELLDVLADVEGYPGWWPQVRSVERVDEESARVRARSFLPYTLLLLLTRSVEDRNAGVFEARITGDLEGWSRWCVQPAGDGCVVRYDQEVTVPGPALRAASTLGRPLLVANHGWMMSGARRGLQRRLNPGRGPAGRTPR